MKMYESRFDTIGSGVPLHRQPRLVKPWLATIDADSPVVWFLLTLAAALPVASTSMPPLTDLGGHLGRYAVQLDPGNPVLSRWYAFSWSLVPNLGVDLLIQALGPWLGLERALWWIVMLIPVIAVGGMIALSRAAHGRVTPTAILAMPLAYSYPFLFGFINFTLGVGLALWAAALWITLERRGRWLERAVFVPIGVALMVCHLAAWAVLFLIAASVSWTRIAGDRPWPRRTVHAAVATVLAVWPLMVPLVLRCATVWTQSGTSAQAMAFELPAKLSALIMPLRDRWALWDIAGALVLVAMLVWAARSPRWRFDRALLVASGLLAAAFVVSPTGIGDLWYVDIRLVPVMFVVLLVSVRPDRGTSRRFQQLWIALAVLFAVSRFAANTVSLVLSDRQWQHELSLIDRVPRNAQMITLVHESRDHDLAWLRERRLHLSGFALERRHIFSNDQWEVSGAHLLRIHNPVAGRFQGDPSQRVHTGDPGDPRLEDVIATVPAAVHYLWVIGEQAPRMPPRWRVVGRIDDTVLYQARS